jgi:hypothetical protein
MGGGAGVVVLHTSGRKQYDHLQAGNPGIVLASPAPPGCCTAGENHLSSSRQDAPQQDPPTTRARAKAGPPGAPGTGSHLLPKALTSPLIAYNPYT